MPNTNTVNKAALKALDGMEQIVRNEMITRHVYISEDIVSPKLRDEGAICGGRQACAIGALWLGYGVKIRNNSLDGYYLPGVGEDERDKFLLNRPGLKLALRALNDEAEAYIKRNKLDNHVNRCWSDAIEALFESRRKGSNTPLVNRGALLRIISRARARVGEVL